MCCEQLVCARCARPVADAGCAVCRATRAELHGTAPVPLALVAMIATLLVLAALVAARLT